MSRCPRGPWLGLLSLLAVGCTRASLNAIGAAPADAAVAAPDAGDAAADEGDVAADAGDAAADATDATDTVVVTCPSQAIATGDTTQTVLGGRTYLLHVPSSYDGSKPVPLILDFHALAGTSAQEESISSYPAQTDQEGVIIAFPDGVNGPAGAGWNVGGCCVSSTVDDVAFARAVVRQIETVACIDPRRVYAVGLYTGGGMAYSLACHAADIFAAVASSAWDLLQENVADCKPSRPTTVVSFRDSNDNSFIPYNGGASSIVPGMKINFLGAQATFKKWAELDHCTGNPTPIDGNGCSTYAACQQDVEVTLCAKPGGIFPASLGAIAWPVLKRHPMP
jgi:polyhydroxybutyrate depolymerase